MALPTPPATITPESALPEMTLPSPASTPPMRFELAATYTPAALFESAAPVADKPIQLPSTLTPEALNTLRPALSLPEIILRDAALALRRTGTEPPITTPTT